MARKTEYDVEFKQQAVRLVLELKKPIAQVARELGVQENTLQGWITATRKDPAQPFVGSGCLRPEDQAMRIFTNDRK